MKDFRIERLDNLIEAYFNQSIWVADFVIEKYHKHKSIDIRSSDEFKEEFKEYAKTIKCLNWQKLDSCWYGDRC
jgi:hypothetical protein